MTLRRGGWTRSFVFAGVSVGVCVGVALGACGPAPSAAPVAVGSFDEFASNAAGILELRCANPSCHGNDDRPLALYATQRRRMDVERLFLDEPLTHQELAANHLNASCFVHDLGTSSSLLQKPLAPTAGGGPHTGGAVFETPRDPDFLRLQAWIDAAVAGRGAP